MCILRFRIITDVRTLVIDVVYSNINTWYLESLFHKFLIKKRNYLDYGIHRTAKNVTSTSKIGLLIVRCIGVSRGLALFGAVLKFLAYALHNH